MDMIALLLQREFLLTVYVVSYLLLGLRFLLYYYEKCDAHCNLELWFSE